MERGDRSGACGRGANVAHRTREASGFRPGPLRGSAASAAGRGQACGAKSPRVATSPEARTRVLRRRGGAPRGVAVCLCFPAIREISRGLLTTRLSALPPPSPCKESEGPEPPTHVKRFAGGDDACPNKGGCTRLRKMGIQSICCLPKREPVHAGDVGIHVPGAGGVVWSSTLRSISFGSR